MRSVEYSRVYLENIALYAGDISLCY